VTNQARDSDYDECAQFVALTLLFDSVVVLLAQGRGIGHDAHRDIFKWIMDPNDTRRAVDLGATAIAVSNHGGNNLDGTPAELRSAREVADRGQ
jgi:isopentenyl diphosphate isomerase/L-lactate dehydrogenase-like FMN-dependent dehydrogenase